MHMHVFLYSYLCVLSCLIYVQLQILGVQVSPVGSKVVQKVIVAFEKNPLCTTNMACEFDCPLNKDCPENAGWPSESDVSSDKKHLAGRLSSNKLKK